MASSQSNAVKREPSRLSLFGAIKTGIERLPKVNTFLTSFRSKLTRLNRENCFPSHQNVRGRRSQLVKGLDFISRIECSKRVQDRGRDAHCWTPPARIRTSPIRASGSYLGCLTAKQRAVRGSAPGSRAPGSGSGACFAGPRFPWPLPLAPPPPQPATLALFGGFTAVGSEEARSTALALASVRRSNWACSFPAPSFHEDAGR